jgi:DamX protein
VTQPSVASRPAPAAAAPVSGGRDAGWILGQSAARYTLQLVSLSSPTRVREFIDLQSDKSRFATYRLQRNGQLFHVVVYGSFASKAEAETAAARLPPSAGAVEPWIRTFGQVQESVRSTPQ